MFGFGRRSKPAAKATQLVAGYEASRLGRRLKSWVADRRNINALLAVGGEPLRARARQLCRENPYAANACEAFVAAAVGTGVKPSPLVEDEALKKEIAQLFLAWTDEADADGLTDFYGLQALAARAMFEAGECFIRFRPRRLQDGLTVPLQLQLLEAEMLPLNDMTVLPNGNEVRCGIEFDAIGRRVNYRFLRNHPGDTPRGNTFGQITTVPADEVLHIYRPLRPGQIRGQPAITPSMVRLYLLDQYDDAEIDRKRVAAMFAGFVTKASPSDGDPVTDDLAEVDGETALQPLEPGLLQVLGPGETITFSEPTEVGGSYEAFQFRNLSAISVGVGLPYHTVSGDLTKANYGSQRGGKVELRRRMDQFQWATLIFQLCRPVWNRWLDTAVLAGAVAISPREYKRSRTTFAAVKWIPPREDWIDPLKDRQAQALAEDRGWISRDDNIEAEGFDPDETDARIAAGRKREEKYDLSFGPAAGAAKLPIAPEPAEPVDDAQPRTAA